MGRTTEEFYGSDAWKRARQRALDRDRGECVPCREAGRRIRLANGMTKPVPAEMVHHIRPISERPDLALRLDNLQSICLVCHAAAHPEKYRRGEHAREELPSGCTARVVKMQDARCGLQNERAAGAPGGAIGTARGKKP